MNKQKSIFSKILQYSKESSIILGLYFIGEGLVSLLDIPFPGSIVGMLLLLFALNLNIVKLHDIHAVSDFLLKYMPLFFIPAGVSIMGSYQQMANHTFTIIAIILLSTFIVMSSTALVLQYFLNKEEK
ncbi:MAG: CidA/LrgA family protein [Sulfurovum sp.]|nr:CidA/LrgA family protein [Sulfurovum sp.]